MQVQPKDFSKHSIVALEDNINAKYANKVRRRPSSRRAALTGGIAQVIQKIGLCICLYDILWASEGLIGHGTGLVNVNGVPASPPPAAWAGALTEG